MLKLITEPYTQSVVSVDDLKKHLRIVSSDDDAYIEALGIAATKFVEDYCNRRLITQTVELHTDGPDCHGYIMLDGGKVQSVTSVKYLDGNKAEQTLSTDDWTEYTDKDPALVLIDDEPTTADAIDAYRIRYVVGYGNREDVPETIKVVIKLLVGEWYGHRELSSNPEFKELPLGIDRLLNAYKSTEVV